MGTRERLTLLSLIAASLSACSASPGRSLAAPSSFGGVSPSISVQSAASIPEAPSSSKAAPSSSQAPSSSADEAAYFTVSVYQSYLMPDGRYGNQRFDFSFESEAGKPLYTNADEMNEIVYRCRAKFAPIGGAYSINYFYIDPGCEKHTSYDTIVERDMPIYYYCTD